MILTNKQLRKLKEKAKTKQMTKEAVDLIETIDFLIEAVKGQNEEIKMLNTALSLGSTKVVRR